MWRGGRVNTPRRSAPPAAPRRGGGDGADTANPGAAAAAAGPGGRAVEGEGSALWKVPPVPWKGGGVKGTAVTFRGSRRTAACREGYARRGIWAAPPTPLGGGRAGLAGAFCDRWRGAERPRLLVGGGPARPGLARLGSPRSRGAARRRFRLGPGALGAAGSRCLR